MSVKHIVAAALFVGCCALLACGTGGRGGFGDGGLESGFCVIPTCDSAQTDVGLCASQACMTAAQGCGIAPPG